MTCPICAVLLAIGVVSVVSGILALLLSLGAEEIEGTDNEDR